MNPVLELEEMELDKFYYLIVNCIDSTDEFDGSYSYVVNGCKAFVSKKEEDTLELANEYIAMLEDELLETASECCSVINPYAYYGLRIDASRLPAREHEYITNYLVFIPNIHADVFTMFTCKSLIEVARYIESELQQNQGLNIEDVIIFQYMIIDLIKQIPLDFDRQAVEMDFTGE